MVTRAVVLDTGPLGQITHPKSTPPNVACAQWFQALIAKGVRVVVPEIVDYELRRELVRSNKTQGLMRLNNLITQGAEYCPITTLAMREAAKFWAQARQQGQPTAGDNTIDCDMILVAQAVTLNEPSFVIATTNVKHLSRFVPADLWQNIT